MFVYCLALESFTSDLSSLEDATYMFMLCTSLKSFNADMPKLKNC